MRSSNDHEREIARLIDERALSQGKLDHTTVSAIATMLKFMMTRTDSEFLIAYLRWRMNNPNRHPDEAEPVRKKCPRVLLADDQPLILDDIRAVLAPHYEIVETVADGRALVEAALRLKPDLIVLDITMPVLNGIDAAVQIKKSLPGMKLVFATMHTSAAYLTAAFEAGGTGYVLKSGLDHELPNAVQCVLSGRIYVSSSLATEDLERFQHPTHSLPSSS